MSYVKKILFIGAINGTNPPLGGEEYKNQLLSSRIKSEFDAVIIDTFNWSKRPGLLLRMCWNLFFLKFDRIVISASSASTYKLIHVLNFFPKKLEKTYYFVIGGYFPQGLRNNVYRGDCYRRLKGIVVEGELLKQEILETGAFDNISVIPNFKIFNRVTKNSQEHFKTSHIRFVFISRITKTKGINEIIEAVETLNRRGYENSFSVDFYGKVEDDFLQEFEARMYLPNCNYKGYLDIIKNSSESYALLSEYHVMLFPTYWRGEGFPGVIIDAFVAGLPVIASDWNMNRDIVVSGRTGELIPYKDAHALASAMQKVIEDKVQWAKMAEYSSEEAEAFHLDTIWPTIKDLMNCE